MKTRSLGWTGAKVAIIGQGSWRMELDDPDSVLAAIGRGLDLGMTHIDTAELYGSGEVEALVARAIRGRRDEVFLASKVMPSNASYDGTLRACERSLERLGTDRLDLYLLHWPGAHPLEETIRAFETLVEQGKIRFWGVSNFDVEDLERALAIAGEKRIACNQVLYHLRSRNLEHAVLPWCERHHVAVVGYSPFGSGHFPRPDSPGGRVLAEIGRAHDASPHQVALAFLVRHAPLFTIPKAATVSHVQANARAAELRLSEEELRRIEDGFARRGHQLEIL